VLWLLKVLVVVDVVQEREWKMCVHAFYLVLGKPANQALWMCESWVRPRRMECESYLLS